MSLENHRVGTFKYEMLIITNVYYLSFECDKNSRITTVHTACIGCL